MQTSQYNIKRITWQQTQENTKPPKQHKKPTKQWLSLVVWKNFTKNVQWQLIYKRVRSPRPYPPSFFKLR